ncbi:hypothetical protein CHU92_08815 [Flavobacterium cyanobacteriorum]|uniref:Uncharacterized protein n=1 Tax=Flavobacterium cyanobacteriorum TaxID=2022802 RepID=A0A255Z8B8_9FLAO|nr:outer membrane beta-barrel protein [Flavobacterium cyanobacteriorum]OYQ37125.1 hypothetical protein CHU92_08815 [Flavobacterium cyanobacteriorum]
MSEKKNIDRLFQEKLKDFEPVPPERVWAGIEAELKKENKDRRVVPLWFKLAGVAAILIMGALLTIPLFNGFDTGKIPVVLEQHNNVRENIPGIRPTHKPIKPGQTVTEAGGQTIVINTLPEKIATGTNDVNAAEATVKATQRHTGKRTVNASAKQKDFSNTNTAISGETVQDDRKLSKNRLPKNNIAVPPPGNVSGDTHEGMAFGNNAVEKQKKGTRNSATGTSKSAFTTTGDATGIDNNEGNTYAQGSSPRNKKADADSNIEENKNKNTVLDNNNTVAATPPDGNTWKNQNSKILNDTIAGNALAMADSVKVVPENELDKLLKEKLNEEKKKEEQLAEAKTDRWNIRPHLAPIFYNSFSNGSPIDSQFASNAKDYDNALSYGVGIDYAINNRLSFRTGVNTVNLSYSTNDIQFYAALGEHTANVSRSSIANVVVENAANENPQAHFADAQLSIQKFDGAMVQKMGYIEVPLEMSYQLVKSRFGIDVIGGLSTLFLNENNVSVVSRQGLSTDIGQAQNLNNIHFTTNIGVGFKYRFWKSFQANFEPTFKYQLNAFSNNPGNFRPYFIGLYSGISFSF